MPGHTDTDPNLPAEISLASQRTYPLAYFDCFHGISGDMTLGALVDAGVPLAALKKELARIPLEGYRLRARKVMRGPLACTKVDVILPGKRSGEGKGRHLRDIETLLRKSSLDKAVVERIREAFHHLARAEAKVHGTTIDKIHFHEVGAVDAIVDIAGAMIGFDRLGVEECRSTTVPLGTGRVTCRHGVIPVPGPATIEILDGCPVQLGTEEAELTTPTGAAILVTMVRDFGPPQPMTVGAVGIGAGDRETDEVPNVLRLVFGDRVGGRRRQGGVYQVETNLDDSTPEVLGYTLERLLALGALDAWIVPVQMKKGRPGATVVALVQADLIDTIEDALFLETSTFGVRSFPVHRSILDRQSKRVKTKFGVIQVKLGSRDGETLTVAPEFESCRRAAEKAGVAIREVYEAASRAFRR